MKIYAYYFAERGIVNYEYLFNKVGEYIPLLEYENSKWIGTNRDKFVYTDLEKCRREGRIDNGIYGHDDYCAILEYNTKSDTITKISYDGTRVIHFRNGSWDNVKYEYDTLVEGRPCETKTSREQKREEIINELIDIYHFKVREYQIRFKDTVKSIISTLSINNIQIVEFENLPFKTAVKIMKYISEE